MSKKKILGGALAVALLGGAGIVGWNMIQSDGPPQFSFEETDWNQPLFDQDWDTDFISWDDEPEEDFPTWTQPEDWEEPNRWSPTGTRHPVLQGLDFRMYYDNRHAAFSFDIHNHGQSFINFDSIVLLADANQTVHSALYIHHYLVPLIGESSFFTAVPESAFTYDIRYFTVVGSYNQQEFEENMALVEQTYQRYFNPLNTQSIDMQQFRTQQQPRRVGHHDFNPDWTVLPSYLVDYYINQFVESLQMPEDDTQIIQPPAEEPEVSTNDFLDLITNPTIQFDGIQVSDLAINVQENTLIFNLRNNLNTTGQSRFSIDLFDVDRELLARVDVGPSIPALGISNEMRFTPNQSLVGARFIQLTER